jgi:D-serine deaminase-like pyridoxal phosphate-dependent protein
MNPLYEIHDTSSIYSPALVFYKEAIRSNLSVLLEMAGDPNRLRPHVKTHKTREIVRMELALGIRKHKCATLAEAEMLADCGVEDVLLAYNLVGPNCRRMAQLATKYPRCLFSVLADHPVAVQALSHAMADVGRAVEVLLDVDVGQHRTGIAPGPEAVALYGSLQTLPGLAPGGLHVYDGHHHQESPAERAAAVRRQMEPVLRLRDTLLKEGLPVPRMVVGGTPTFPAYAMMELPGLECAPGTSVLHDAGYSRFPDLAKFTPAAILYSRVMSKPAGRRLTLDLGYKALASDPPAGKRCALLNVPEYEPVLQNEEHFVIETPLADRFQPGDEVYAVPTHVCPTCAVHRQAYVVEDHRVTETWDIAARDRILTI